MNLRISPQMLRFRISRAELADLQQGKALTAQLALSSGNENDNGLDYAIQPVASLPVNAGSNGLLTVQSGIANNRLGVQLNATPAALVELDRDPPAKDGIHDYQSSADGQLLTLVLEVDLGNRGKKS